MMGAQVRGPTHQVTKVPEVTDSCTDAETARVRVGLDLQTQQQIELAGRLPRAKDQEPLQRKSGISPRVCSVGPSPSTLSPTANPWSDRDRLALDGSPRRRQAKLYLPRCRAAEPCQQPGVTPRHGPVGGFPSHGHGTARGTKAAGCEMMDSEC